MSFVPLRLHPGDDLRGALESADLGESGGSAFVVSGIGSLENARLRFAGDTEATLVPGPSEILTLAGSLSRDGAHLHMTVADARGQVHGGHVVQGNTVRTTAEVLLALLPDWELARSPDAATGYLELAVRRRTPPD